MSKRWFTGQGSLSMPGTEYSIPIFPPRPSRIFTPPHQAHVRGLLSEVASDCARVLHVRSPVFRAIGDVRTGKLLCWLAVNLGL